MASDAWLVLLQTQPSTPAAWRRALRKAGSAESLLATPVRELVSGGVSPESAARLRKPDANLLARWRGWLDERGHALVTLDDPAYPPQLREIPDAPLALWVEGTNTALLAGAQLAIVGSRNPTSGGRANAESFAEHLSRRGLTITSGLATGIDSASHRGAIDGTGSTIAVLGCGIDSVYPRRNRKLAARIAERGLIASEYPPGTPVRAFQFPQRNRIIAGLSLGTLVVEATRRSGSLITARLAADYGRDVFAIPGSIHNPLAKGCHKLIRDGAAIAEEGDEILAELAPQLVASEPGRPDATHSSEHPLTDDPAYARLLDLLGFEPVRAADLLAAAGLTAAELSSMLLLLEMGGVVEALPGARYCRLVRKNR